MGCCKGEDTEETKTDPFIPTGLTTNRHCTDVCCCIIWVLFFTFCIFSAIYGYTKGNLNNVAQPIDADGTFPPQYISNKKFRQYVR